MIKIEIIGIHDLIAFIALIRNENLDALIARLNQATDKLVDAEHKQESDTHA